VKKQIFENNIKDYYSELIKNENHRFQSWEHCYISFRNAFKKKSLDEKEKNILSLHLAFYLASWGMYRGSSFILQKDYKIFYPIIHLLFSNKEYFKETYIESLLKNKDDNETDQYVKKYCDLDNDLSIILEKIRSSVKGDVESKVSYTLKTKILLGTFGCVPAYDRFFEKGIRDKKKEHDLIIAYSKNGLKKLIKFAKKNVNELDKIKKHISNIQNNNSNLNKVEYPYMKLMDMLFWKIGFDLELEEERLKKENSSK